MLEFYHQYNDATTLKAINDNEFRDISMDEKKGISPGRDLRDNLIGLRWGLFSVLAICRKTYTTRQNVQGARSPAVTFIY